jgi:hypothetical protein
LRIPSNVLRGQYFTLRIVHQRLRSTCWSTLNNTLGMVRLDCCFASLTRSPLCCDLRPGSLHWTVAAEWCADGLLVQQPLSTHLQHDSVPSRSLAYSVLPFPFPAPFPFSFPLLFPYPTNPLSLFPQPKTISFHLGPGSKQLLTTFS